MPAILAVLLLLASVGACAAPQSITGTVKRVLDGDSLIVRSAGRDIEVRLGEIDTPEKGQPYADVSRKALQGMLLGKKVRLQVLDRDQYGRTVARVYRLPEELWVNAELVRRGHAWVYRRHVRDKTLYDLERDARAREAGLWALPEAERTPPWQWRRAHPPDRQRAPAPTRAPAYSVFEQLQAAFEFETVAHQVAGRR